MRSTFYVNGLILAIMSILSGCQIITVEDYTRLDQATVLIDNRGGHATGFLVGEDRILTSDQKIHLSTNFVVFKQGERHRATVIWHDSALGLALLDVDVPSTYEALPFRCRDAVKGERLWTIGHHGEAKWVVKRGPIHTVKVMKQGYQVLGFFLEFGTAGSAVVNHRGELVGMVQALAIMPIEIKSDEGGSSEIKKVGLMLPAGRFCDDVEQALGRTTAPGSGARLTRYSVTVVQAGGLRQDTSGFRAFQPIGSYLIAKPQPSHWFPSPFSG